MKNKLPSIFLGLILILSLGFGSTVFAQATVVQHETGDVLIYSTQSAVGRDESSDVEIYDLDNATTLHYGEESRIVDETIEGDTFVSLVSLDDLNHIPSEIDPANDPDFPADASIFGMQVDSQETLQGTENSVKNNYDIERMDDPNNGWDNSTDSFSYGPEQYYRQTFEAGIASGDFSLIPFMDENDDILNTTSVIFAGQNFSGNFPFDFPFFDNQWIHMDLMMDVGFYQQTSVTVNDGNGNPTTVDLYGANVHAYGSLTNYLMNIPLGDSYNPDTPWVSVNVTFNVDFQSNVEYYIDRDSNNGLFLGFEESVASSVWGTFENDAVEIYIPESNQYLNISVFSNFEFGETRDFSVLNTDFLRHDTPTDPNSGLETGDELHYQVDEYTEINFAQYRVDDNSPDGDGPDPSNITYVGEDFEGTIDINQDLWLTVYHHTSEAVGVVMETVWNDITMTGFPDDGGSGGDGPGDGPMYLVEIIPLIDGNPDFAGLVSTAEKELAIPVESERGPQVSQLFELQERDNEDGDDGLIGFLNQLSRDIGVDFQVAITSDLSSLDLHDITVNTFDYVIVGNNITITYELSISNSVPYDLEGDQTPPATMDYELDFTVVDTRIYDNATGALVYKADYTDFFVNTTINADVSNFPEFNTNELKVMSTEVSYYFSNEATLVEHSKDFQAAQDPADIPEDPNQVDNNTNGDEEDSPQLSLPGFELPLSFMAVGISVIFVKKFKDRS